MSDKIVMTVTMTERQLEAALELVGRLTDFRGLTIEEMKQTPEAVDTAFISVFMSSRGMSCLLAQETARDAVRVLEGCPVTWMKSPSPASSESSESSQSRQKSQ